MPGKIRVIHVINSFALGGAEVMLRNLLLRTDRSRMEPSVASLIDDLSAADPVVRAGIAIATMGMRPGVPDPRGLTRLASYLGRQQPDIVQTWMDHSNLIGGMAARASTRAHVVWGIHHSDHLPHLTKRSTLFTVSLCGRLSRHLPSRIVYCSEHGRNLYTRRGFASEQATVIPNGIDTALFQPDDVARVEVRRELGLSDDALLVGLAARYDPLKDHAMFIEAAALLVARLPEVRFVLCGRNIDAANDALMSGIRRLALAGNVHLLGPRRDMTRIHAALDVACSSSVSEAFSLAVAEAMSSGVPCVVTDVGDSSLMVGATGRVTPPKDPHAFARACYDLLALPAAARRELGQRARRRIRELYDLTMITRRYESLYEDLACDSGPSAPDLTAEASPAATLA